VSAAADAAPFEWASVAGPWNRFFYAEMDARPLAVMRIAYAVLLLINMLVLAPDLELWFSESGVLPLVASRQIVDPDTWTLFSWLPTSTSVLWACYFVCLAQIVLLGLGVWSRFQAACLFVWLISFHHRFIILFDGEDILFRLLVFFFILAPISDFYSVDAWWARRRGKVPPPRAVWPLRLIQIEISLIYASTVLLKLSGTDWVSGDALYYVSRLDDLYGHFPAPSFVFESILLVRLLSWSVLLVEGVTPFVLWFRETRRTALVIAFAFHFATDWAMNLFLFQWLMMVGLLSFTVPADWAVLKRRARQLARLARLRKDDAATRSARIGTVALFLVFIPLLLRPLGAAANAATATVVFLRDSITLGEGVRKEENVVSLLTSQFTVADAEPGAFRLVHLDVSRKETAGRPCHSARCGYGPGLAWDQRHP
jgi:vitamin K-dependent gamma-carboxylase-like protein